jgi:hypothetical protein
MPGALLAAAGIGSAALLTRLEQSDFRRRVLPVSAGPVALRAYDDEISTEIA